MDDDTKKIVDAIGAKIPKFKQQELIWLKATEDDLFDELFNSGLDYYSIIGLLEKVKHKLLLEAHKIETNIKKK